MDFLDWTLLEWMPLLPPCWTVIPRPVTMSTRVECRCDKRKDAEAGGELVYRPSLRAWVIPDAPLRAMSMQAKYYAFAERVDFPHDDHTGEQYTFTTCVFCGNDLPYIPTPLPGADGYPFSDEDGG